MSNLSGKFNCYEKNKQKGWISANQEELIEVTYKLPGTPKNRKKWNFWSMHNKRKTCQRTGDNAVATGAEGADGVCVLMIYCSGAAYLTTKDIRLGENMKNH